jgi:hypothetical protein
MRDPKKVEDDSFLFMFILIDAPFEHLNVLVLLLPKGVFCMQ